MPAGEVRRLWRHFYTAFGGENHTTALAGEGDPPLVAGATTFPPQAVGLWVLSNVDMSLQESIETYSSPACGGSPAQPDRGRRA